MISSFVASSFLFFAFGIPSGIDLVFLFMIVLMIFGVKRLPEIAKSLGQSIHEFKKVKQEFENQIDKPATSVASTPAAATPAAAIPASPATDVAASHEAPKTTTQS